MIAEIFGQKINTILDIRDDDVEIVFMRISNIRKTFTFPVIPDEASVPQ